MPRGLRNLSGADVRSLTVARLRQELTACSLSSDGLKQELVNRLEAALEAAAPQPVTDAALDREPLAPRHDESELRATILSGLRRFETVRVKISLLWDIVQTYRFHRL